MSVTEIGAKQARHDVEISDALLVCAYESQEKFESHYLQGAMSLDDLHEHEGSLSKQREIIFYCA